MSNRPKFMQIYICMFCKKTKENYYNVMIIIGLSYILEELMVEECPERVWSQLERAMRGELG